MPIVAQMFQGLPTFVGPGPVVQTPVPDVLAVPAFSSTNGYGTLVCVFVKNPAACGF